MNLDNILSEWKTDAAVDDLNIDLESAKVPNLHAKYMRYLSDARSRLRFNQLKRRRLVKLLRSYYSGACTQAELNELKREQFQKRVLRGDIETHIDEDDDIIDLDTKILGYQERVDVLGEIIRSINNRSYNLRNIVDWRRLTLGG